jgi:arylamine N-acetyltransferase
MKHDPLAPARPDSEVARLFLAHFGLARDAPRERLLEDVARAFARLPYENLTKIIKRARCGRIETARRMPQEVVTEHVTGGTGGTCFSLTACLLHVVRALGWRAEPILADRQYGTDTHCALVVWMNGEPHVLDPGYLIVRPLKLALRHEARLPNAFNELILSPQGGGEKLDLYTVQQGRETYRLTYKTSPADPGAFLNAWDASFDWDMMRYPVLTRVAGERQFYLQDRRLQVRSLDAISRAEVAAEVLPACIVEQFGIEMSVVARALEVLERQGVSSTRVHKYSDA